MRHLLSTWYSGGELTVNIHVGTKITRITCTCLTVLAGKYTNKTKQSWKKRRQEPLYWPSNVHQQRRSMHFSVFKTFLPWPGHPCVRVLLTNWQLYATRQDRHRHQSTFSHCSYHTSPLDHCGQATHRGWPFLELEQFLPAVLSLSLHRPSGTHCRTMLSTQRP